MVSWRETEKITTPRANVATRKCPARFFGSGRIYFRSPPLPALFFPAQDGRQTLGERAPALRNKLPLNLSHWLLRRCASRKRGPKVTYFFVLPESQRVSLRLNGRTVCMRTKIKCDTRTKSAQNVRQPHFLHHRFIKSRKKILSLQNWQSKLRKKNSRLKCW